jgi:cathepsin L
MFLNFKNKFNKIYESLEEHENRYRIFLDNLEIINTHNTNNDDWKMDINIFADLRNDEFKKIRVNGFTNNEPNTHNFVLYNYFESPDDDKVPDSWDWTEKGAVTPVKDQAQCGSCFAFSSIGALEGAYFLKTGKLVSLSEQQLVDCSSNYGNQGCGGGLMDNCFKYVIDNGICSEKDYPYSAADGVCKKCKSVFKIKSFVDVKVNDESELEKAVYKQPVSIAIEADQSVFQFYSSGILTSSSNCGTNLDHGVTLVGFGVDSKTGKKFWKIKNSWGSSWGENGYIRMEKDISDKSGMCGLAMMASYPLLE